MPNDFIEYVTADDIVATLSSLGWPANLTGSKAAPNIASAVNGVKFNVRFGTPAKNGCSDFTIFATFDVDQDVTPVLGASWNRRQRFARVYRTEKQIVLDMDVVATHGVSRANLKHHFAIWADVTKLFLQHLKADYAAVTRQKANGLPGKTKDSASAMDGQARRSQQNSRGTSQMGGKLATAT